MRVYRRGPADEPASRIQQEMEHMFNSLWNWRYPMGVSPRGPWQPPTDVFETSDALIVEMEVAGVREEDLNVTVCDTTLTVTGVREDRRSDKVTYYQLGISYGSFQTQVHFTIPIDVDGVVATYENGILSIVLPKAKPVQVEARAVTLDLSNDLSEERR